MIGRLLSCTLLALSLPVLSGCAPVQFTTITIFDTPTAFVRLETNRTVGPGRGHSHPVSMTLEQMAAVLSGITMEEPLAKLPIYDDLSLPRHHPAFTDNEVSFFAPLLVAALSKTTPEEVVTFYETNALSGTNREVTSGGLFVQGQELHFILANYRSPTHYAADIGVADTTDDRLTPMQSLAPQRGRLDFDPASAKREPRISLFAKMFQLDRREVIVSYKLLPPQPLRQPSSIR